MAGGLGVVVRAAVCQAELVSMDHTRGAVVTERGRFPAKEFGVALERDEEVDLNSTATKRLAPGVDPRDFYSADLGSDAVLLEAWRGHPVFCLQSGDEVVRICV